MTDPIPPVARRIPVATTLHGDTRVDDYGWLRDKSNPEVIRYLESENAYTDEVTKPFVPLQETLYAEILRRTKQTDQSAPHRRDGYWYYSRTVEGKQYPIYCRKKGTLQANEEITLDLNELAAGHQFLSLGFLEISDDGTLLAYSLDFTGFRQYQLFIRNLATGEVLPDRIDRVSTAVWAADNRTLFYVREDDAKRAYRFYRHVLGEEVDILLFEEKDEMYRIWTERSSDRSLIFLGSASSITTEMQYLPAKSPSDRLQIIHPREEGHEYQADCGSGVLFIRTNKNAKNFRLVSTPLTQPEMKHWTEFVGHRPDIKIEGFQLFEDHLVLNERDRGLDVLRILDRTSLTSRSIDFPEPTYAALPDVNAEYATDEYRFSYQSFITPPSVFSVNMRTGERSLLKQTEVLGGYDGANYVCERIFATAPDGVSVPLSIVYRKGLKRDGSNPFLLYGYGAYGITIPVTFSIGRLSLLERGVVYALAHVRGGGDMGEEWRDDGKTLRKRNTFTDFIACAEHVIRQKYTSPDLLGIDGRSAGGLLIGATVNMRPDLFKAAHLGVPFVDVINTMLDESLPLTVGEFLEWGNPKVKEEYDYIRTYCPYTNIADKEYPDLLITTSLNDSQVMYWEPAKYTARMRAVRSDREFVLLKTNMGAGHGGSSGRYDAYREQAFISAFFLNEFGIKA